MSAIARSATADHLNTWSEDPSQQDCNAYWAALVETLCREAGVPPPAFEPLALHQQRHLPAADVTQHGLFLRAKAVEEIALARLQGRIRGPRFRARIAMQRRVDKDPVHTYSLFMANLTLSIPDDLLKRSRRHAEARGRSLNALVRELLSQAVSDPDSSVEDFINSLRTSAGDSKGMKVVREELHRY